MRNRVIVAAAAAWLLAALAPAVAAPAVHDTAPMLTLPPPFVEIEGSSASLVATEDWATITVKTSGLIEGNVYTLWGVTFSFPENCIDGCGFDDAADRPGETGFAFQKLGGHVTGQSGNVNFGGNIAVVNAQGAEYHIVIAEHGALDPEQLPGSIQTPTELAVQIAFLGH